MQGLYLSRGLEEEILADPWIPRSPLAVQQPVSHKDFQLLMMLGIYHFTRLQHQMDVIVAGTGLAQREGEGSRKLGKFVPPFVLPRQKPAFHPCSVGAVNYPQFQL